MVTIEYFNTDRCKGLPKKLKCVSAKEGQCCLQLWKKNEERG